MARGGKREGAGRRLGSATRRTRKIADQATEEGITPLEVMLRTMRAVWNKAAPGGVVKNQKNALLAAALAEKVAPFIHPRLSSSKAEVKGALTLEALVTGSLKK